MAWETRHVSFRTITGKEVSLKVMRDDNLGRLAPRLREALEGPPLLFVKLLNNSTQEVTQDNTALPFANQDAVPSYTVVFYWQSTWRAELQGELQQLCEEAYNSGWPQAGIDAQHAGSAYSTPCTSGEWRSEGGLSLGEAASMVFKDLFMQGGPPSLRLGVSRGSFGKLVSLSWSFF